MWDGVQPRLVGLVLPAEPAPRGAFAMDPGAVLLGQSGYCNDLHFIRGFALGPGLSPRHGIIAPLISTWDAWLPRLSSEDTLQRRTPGSRAPGSLPAGVCHGSAPTMPQAGHRSRPQEKELHPGELCGAGGRLGVDTAASPAWLPAQRQALVPARPTTLSAMRVTVCAVGSVLDKRVAEGAGHPGPDGVSSLTPPLPQPLGAAQAGELPGGSYAAGAPGAGVGGEPRGDIVHTHQQVQGER